MDLDKGAEWLRNLTNAEIADLHAYDKADIAQSLARLVSVAEAAGVLGWRDEELDNKLREVALGGKSDILHLLLGLVLNLNLNLNLTLDLTQNHNSSLVQRMIMKNLQE